MKNLKLWIVRAHDHFIDHDVFRNIWALTKDDAEAKLDNMLDQESQKKGSTSDVVIFSATPIGEMVNGVFVLAPELQASYVVASELEDGMAVTSPKM